MPQLLIDSADMLVLKFRMRMTTVVLCIIVSILLCVYVTFMQRYDAHASALWVLYECSHERGVVPTGCPVGRTP